MAGIGENNYCKVLQQCQYVFKKGMREGQRCMTGVAWSGRDFCSAHIVQHEAKEHGTIQRAIRRGGFRSKHGGNGGDIWADLRAHERWAMGNDSSDSDEE
jgi:hypothetical protein